MNLQIKTKLKLKAWLIWPLFLSLSLSIIVYFVVGKTQAVSMFLGTLTALIPQAIFGFYCFRHTGALHSRQIWQGFVRGEVLKLASASAIFALIFHYLSVMPLWYFLAFILMQFIQLVINCWLLNR
jgi:ATP synthase protein I